MAQQRQEIEAFVRRLAVEVEAATAMGVTAPQAIAEHLNAKGVTTHKGRRWTASQLHDLLSSWANPLAEPQDHRPTLRH